MAYVKDKDVMRTSFASAKAVDYHDRVRWGPILAGATIAVVLQLVLSILGSAVSFSFGTPIMNVEAAGTEISIWTIFNIAISLFVAGWLMARTCGPMNKKTALLNGTILWATTLTFGLWLLASGITGTVAIAVSSSRITLEQVPARVRIFEPNPEQAAEWLFVFGSLLGLVASSLGSLVGASTAKIGYRS